MKESQISSRRLRDAHLWFSTCDLFSEQPLMRFWAHPETHENQGLG
jgi:hypothetical protein